MSHRIIKLFMFELQSCNVRVLISSQVSTSLHNVPVSLPPSCALVMRPGKLSLLSCSCQDLRGRIPNISSWVNICSFLLSLASPLNTTASKKLKINKWTWLLNKLPLLTYQWHHMAELFWWWGWGMHGFVNATLKTDVWILQAWLAGFFPIFFFSFFFNFLK